MNKLKFETRLGTVLTELNAAKKRTQPKDSVYYHCQIGFIYGMMFAIRQHLFETNWVDNQLEGTELEQAATGAAYLYAGQPGCGVESIRPFIEGFTEGYINLVDYDGTCFPKSLFQYAKSFSSGYQTNHVISRLNKGGAV